VKGWKRGDRDADIGYHVGVLGSRGFLEVTFPAQVSEVIRPFMGKEGDEVLEDGT